VWGMWCMLAARWENGSDVGLVIKRSWVQLPFSRLGCYLDGDSLRTGKPSWYITNHHMAGDAP